MTASWTETELPATLSRYELNNLFHTDEFGLFFSMSARKKHLIWDLKSVQVVSKVRFARPEKLLQITSAKNFNYLQWEYQRVQNVKSLHLRYQNQKRAGWRENSLRSEWKVCVVVLV